MYPDLNFGALKSEENSSSRGMSVSALAFLGDGVWGLLVREHLAVHHLCKADKLHEENIKMVNASFQCNAMKKISESLTEDERTMYIRGRNTHTAHTPRNKSKQEYHEATGLEVLFGWLYINGDTDRIKELFKTIISDTQ